MPWKTLMYKSLNTFIGNNEQGADVCVVLRNSLVP